MHIIHNLPTLYRITWKLSSPMLISNATDKNVQILCMIQLSSPSVSTCWWRTLFCSPIRKKNFTSVPIFPMYVECRCIYINVRNIIIIHVLCISLKRERKTYETFIRHICLSPLEGMKKSLWERKFHKYWKKYSATISQLSYVSLKRLHLLLRREEPYYRLGGSSGIHKQGKLLQ